MFPALALFGVLERPHGDLQPSQLRQREQSCAESELWGNFDVEALAIGFLVRFRTACTSCRFGECFEAYEVRAILGWCVCVRVHL